ncbi:MAG: RNA chaperone Hfq [Candidatus Magnetoovum sp. WYHC-5]|nr:RNA chaperone Hfq [Candidatus Magnetoovum sp. WYHC-5]
MGGIKNTNLQDTYLNVLRKEKVNVTVYLMNGVRLKGMIKAFDSFVIILQEQKQQLIYKHAVSSIVPDQDINVIDDVRET